MPDFSNYLFRCHSLGNIMAYPDNLTLPAGAITECNEIHREVTTNRRRTIKSPYLDKGNAREEDAITMLARYLKVMLKKNEERLNNAYLSGIPDLYVGESIRKARIIYDTKCAWKWSTMPFKTSKIDAGHEWQDHAYMALTGAAEAVTAYCLLNTPVGLIDDLKRIQYYKFGTNEEDEGYVKACKKIEVDHIYDMAYFRKENPHYDLAHKPGEWKYDYPVDQRLILQPVKRDEKKIVQIYNRIDLCRQYMNTL